MESDTGKSFLIETIKHWIRIHLKKATVISAPMDIAAFNIDGLMIHKIFLSMNLQQNIRTCQI